MALKSVDMAQTWLCVTEELILPTSFSNLWPDESYWFWQGHCFLWFPRCLRLLMCRDRTKVRQAPRFNPTNPPLHLTSLSHAPALFLTLLYHHITPNLPSMSNTVDTYIIDSGVEFWVCVCTNTQWERHCVICVMNECVYAREALCENRFRFKCICAMYCIVVCVLGLSPTKDYARSLSC